MNTRQLIANQYQILYDTSVDICKAYNTNDIPLTTLHAIIDKAKVHNQYSKNYNDSLDTLCNQCVSMCTKTNSKAVAIPVLDIFIKLMIRTVLNDDTLNTCTPPLQEKK